MLPIFYDIINFKDMKINNKMLSNMAKILPILCKTLFNQSIDRFINQSINQSEIPWNEECEHCRKKYACAGYSFFHQVTK